MTPRNERPSPQVKIRKVQRCSALPSAQLSTTGNDTGHVILRGDKHGPNYSAAHIAETKRKLVERGLPEVVVVDASHGNSQKNHLRQIDVVRDLAGQLASGEQAIRGVMVESNLVAGRQK